MRLLRTGMSLSPKGSGFFRGPKAEAAGTVTKDIRPGKRPSDDGGKKGILFPSQQRYNIHILRQLHKCRKYENVYRQGRCALRHGDPAQAAEQHRDKGITDIGADKAIVNK